MRTVSTDFKNAMKAPVKEIEAKLIIEADVDEITSSDDLIKFTIEGEALAVGKSVLRKLTAEYLGGRILTGQIVTASFGVRLPSDEFEYVDQGQFVVTQCEVQKDTGKTILTGYDLMIYSILPYVPDLVEYPSTVGALYGAITSSILLTPETTTIPFGDLDLTQDLYENIANYQFRNVLEDMAILGGSIAMINEDNQVAFRNIKAPTNDLETLSYDDLKKLTIKSKYGKVNSLVLSRQPQEDNVVLQNEESVTDDGLTEIKVVNNEIIDKRRENVIEDMFEYFDQTEYYPFQAETIGLGWYEFGDRLNIIDEDDVVREVRIMGIKLTVDGSIKETLYSSEPSKTATNYQMAGGLNNRVRNTELSVDKQNQIILGIVSQVDTIEGVVNENYTSIQQTLTEIIQSVQTTGGINLLRNSAFYQVDDAGLPTLWDMTGAGTFDIEASSEAIAKGSLSGNTITLQGVSVKQTVQVVQDSSETADDNKTWYSFKVLLKKGVIGTATVHLYNDTDDFEITIPDSVAYDFDEVVFEALLPQDNTFTVELSGSDDSDAEFTDAMFSVGKFPSAWSQANGEILNTNVEINENGIIVKSSVYSGDYTAITPLEFSGYSKVDGGELQKVFTLNKDQTEVKKLYSNKEITMPPFKIVPITEGSVTGWAFVKVEAD